MKRLLRGIIDIESLSQEELAHNYQRLRASKIAWVQPADDRIFKFVRSFFESELDLPHIRVLVDFFGQREDHEVIERLKDINATPPMAGANYGYVLKTLMEDQNKIRLMTVLKETQEVATKGLVVGEGKQKERLEGVEDAIVYFQRVVSELLEADNNSRTRGELREASMDAKQDYLDAKANPGEAWGCFTGIDIIDTACHGLKKGEMWVHAAFAGELKSTLALTWCYNLVTRYRKNVFYVSLEMPFKQVRNIICVMHSSHPRWVLQGKRPLDYRKVRDGELTEEEEAFYFDVLDDFFNNPEYSRFELWCPDHDVTVADIKMEAELLHKQMEVSFCCIDHGGLVVAPHKAGKGTTEELNSVLRDTKKLALHFNHGEGLPVLMLFQINRLGKDEAEKNRGRYKMKALSYSNECVVAGTLVRTDRGLLPIEEVPVGSRVWSSSGWKTVVDWMDNGVRPTVVVSTSEGFELRCTPDHRFRVLGKNGLEWVRADQLLDRHVLADMGPESFEGGVLPLPPLEVGHGEKPNGDQGAPLKVPNQISPSLAYLMGAHDGDGVQGNDYKVGWTGSAKETHVRAALTRAFEECFGHPLPVHSSPSRPGSFDCAKWSKPLSRWFNSVGMDRQPSVSPYVLQASPVIQGAYLRGLWDTDGSINSQGVLYLVAARDKKPLLKQVHHIMWGLGIPCTLKDGSSKLEGKTHPNSYIQILSQKGKARFLEVTGGFTEPAKRDRLLKACGRRPLEKVLWPLGDTFLRVFERYVKPHWTKPGVQFHRSCVIAARRVRAGRDVVPHGDILRLLGALSHVSGDPDLDYLKIVLTCRPQLVTSVTPSEPAQVYDLEVTGDHEYSTGGLLTHNCERSADYVTTTYLDDALREAGRTIFCCLKNRDNPFFPPFEAGVDFTCRRVYNLDPGEALTSEVSAEEMDELLGDV